ncbi:hypothetical protein F5Y07DRAFT_170562 [Xylaria sp. FL0933]|nr:hypothetical protein F5Y07DRAFT_170562 [Xylaria sp. FL0933]
MLLLVFCACPFFVSWSEVLVNIWPGQTGKRRWQGAAVRTSRAVYAQCCAMRIESGESWNRPSEVRYNSLMGRQTARGKDCDDKGCLAVCLDTGLSASGIFPFSLNVTIQNMGIAKL